MIWSAMPKSRQRWVMNLSISSKVPASNSRSMRSRAVSFPASRCRRSRSSPPPSSARRSRSLRLSSGFDTRCIFPFFEELLEIDVGERMLEALLDHGGRTGHDIGAHPRRLDDVNRVTDAGDQHLGRVFVVVEDVNDLADQSHPGR